MKLTRLAFSLVLSIALSLAFSTSFAADEASVVCKKRTPQVYHAFYRAEIHPAPEGGLRFEYGVGDQRQIYQLHYQSSVLRTGEDTFASPEGTAPRLEVEILEKRGKRTLQFKLIGSDGKGVKRGGYRCE